MEIFAKTFMVASLQDRTPQPRSFRQSGSGWFMRLFRRVR